MLKLFGDRCSRKMTAAAEFTARELLLRFALGVRSRDALNPRKR